MPDKDSFTLNVSTTIKSMLKNLYRSTRKINEFGIRNMTYNELKEFFKLVRLIQEFNSANDCWTFFRNSKRLRIRIIETHFTEIGRQHGFSNSSLYLQGSSQTPI